MDDQHFLHRIAKPKDCALCFGIPVSPKEFDLRKMVAGSVEAQSKTAKRKYLNTLEKLMPEFQKSGAGIFPNLTLQKLGEVCNCGYSTVILFSHWLDDPKSRECFIELEGGFVPLEKVIEAIPETFSGIFELTICTPSPLVELVKWKFADHVLVFYSHQEVIFRYWLWFYFLLFKKLEMEERSYLDAHLEVVEALAKKFPKNEK